MLPSDILNGEDASIKRLHKMQARTFRLLTEAALDVYGHLDMGAAYNRGWDVIDEDINLGAVLPPHGRMKLGRGEQIPVFENEHQLYIYQARSRVLAFYNEFAMCGIENRVNYIIGEGLDIKTEPVDPENEKHRQLSERTQEYIDLIVELNDLDEMQAETVFRCDEDGEAFIRIFENPNHGYAEFRFVEPEHVRPPLGNGWPAETSFGVQTYPGDIETPIRYWLCESPLQGGWVPRPVDEKEIVHFKFNVKRNSKRGLPTFMPVEQNLRRCEELLKSLTTMAKTRAKIALLVKLTGVTNQTALDLANKLTKARITDPLTGEALNLEKLPYASIIRHGGNAEYQFPGGDVGAPDYVEVLQAELRAIAGRIQFPEWMFTAVADAKYSNAFVVESPVLKAFKRKQKYVANKFVNNRFGHRTSVIWRAVKIAIKNGLLDRDVFDCVKIVGKGQSLETRDKQQEATMNRTYNEMGVKSKKTIQMELGLECDTEKNHFKEETADDTRNLLKEAIPTILQVQQQVYSDAIPRDAGISNLILMGIDRDSAILLLPEKLPEPPGGGPPGGGPPGGMGGASGSESGGGPGGIPGGGPNPNPDSPGPVPSANEGGGDDESGATDVDQFDLDSAVTEFWDSIGFDDEEDVSPVIEQYKLQEAGFTGTIKDKLGRTIHYQGGKRVAGSSGQADSYGLLPEAKKSAKVLKAIPGAKVPVPSGIAKKAKRLQKVAPSKAKQILKTLGKTYKKVNPAHAKRVEKAYNKALKKYGPTLATAVVGAAIARIDISRIADHGPGAVSKVMAVAKKAWEIYSNVVNKAVKISGGVREQYFVPRMTKGFHFRLLEAGFTGSVVASNGKVFYYQDGKRVPNPHKGTVPPSDRRHKTAPDARTAKMSAEQTAEIAIQRVAELKGEHLANFVEKFSNLPAHKLKEIAKHLGLKLKGRLKDDILKSLQKKFPIPQVPAVQETPATPDTPAATLDRADIADDEPVELYQAHSGEVVWSGTHADAKQLMKDAVREEGETAVAGLAIRRPGEATAQGETPTETPAATEPESLPPPSNYQEFKTGQPIKATVYRGEATGGSGSGMAALGHGRYFALEPVVAERFSRKGTVQASTVELKNPVVISSDAEMKAIKLRAERLTGQDFGRKGNNYVGYLHGDQPAAFTSAIKSMGYDGIVTTYKEAPGGQQVVVFPKDDDIGPPPFPGAVFDRNKHRWVNPDGSEPTPRQTATAATDTAGYGTSGNHPLAGKSRDEQIRQLGDAIARSEAGEDDVMGHESGSPAGLDMEAFTSDLRGVIGRHAQVVGGVGAAVDEVYKAVGSKYGLSKQDFNRALVAAHDADAVRLGGWPASLNDIPDPELAPVVSAKVMGYVQPASANQIDAMAGEGDPALNTSHPAVVARHGKTAAPSREQFGRYGSPTDPPKTDRDVDLIIGDYEADVVKRTFGSHLSTAHIAGLGNAIDGCKVTVRVVREAAVSIDTSKEGIKANRVIERDENGDLVMFNNHFAIADEAQGQGLGIQLFLEQVRAARQLGIKKMETGAAGYFGHPEYNGYTTWAKFGYDGRIRDGAWNKMPAELKAIAGRERSVLKLHLDPRGTEWWVKNGNGFEGVFDLTDGSPSMKKLEAYVAARVKKENKNG